MNWKIKQKISKELFDLIKHSITSIEVDGVLLSEEEVLKYIESNFVK
jgi:hypothetical protein